MTLRRRLDFALSAVDSGRRPSWRPHLGSSWAAREEISRWRMTGKKYKVTYDDNRKVGRKPKRVGSKRLVRPTQLTNYGHESEVSELRYENGGAGSYENDSSQPESNQAKSRTLLDVANWRKISTKFGHIFESPYGDRLLPKQVSDKMHQSISNLSKSRTAIMTLRRRLDFALSAVDSGRRPSWRPHLGSSWAARE
eukprot:gene16845-8318_t